MAIDTKQTVTEDIEVILKRMKRCSSSLIIGEMQIKTTVRCPFVPDG